MKKISVCHIGAGRIGFTLEFDKKEKASKSLGHVKSNKDIKLSGVSEKNINKKLLDKISKNITVYKNFVKMIKNEKPDIVSIATWKDTHYAITNKYRFRYKSNSTGKPLANNINQAIKLHKKINKEKVKVLVNHRRRYDEEIIKLKNKINSGFIGDIIQVSSYYV